MASVTKDTAPLYRIRAARADEVEAMQRIDLASSELFLGTGLIDFGPDDQPLEAIPETRLRQGLGEALVWVAIDERDEAVGFALCADRGEDLYLDQLSVMPDHGRRGLGARLTRMTLQEAEKRSYKRVSLSTFKKVPWNAPFYKKLGFKEIPHWRLTDWQLAIELAQRETMDVKKRCFMQRPAGRRWS